MLKGLPSFVSNKKKMVINRREVGLCSPDTTLNLILNFKAFKQCYWPWSSSETKVDREKMEESEKKKLNKVRSLFST